MKKILLPLALCCITSVAVAEDVEYGYSGSASAGLTMTSGNTDTTNAVLDAYIKNETEQARHNYFANLLQTEESGNTTGDRFLIGYKYDYKLTDVSYIWVEGRYEQDKFSSYDNQLIGSTGYGRRIFNDDLHSLDVEAGIGYRSSELLTGNKEEEAVFRGAVFYSRQLSETASFNQDIVVIAGSSNTAIDSKTAIRAQIAGNIAAEAAYIVKHNTDVLPGTDKTDSTTALSIVYGF